VAGVLALAGCQTVGDRVQPRVPPAAFADPKPVPGGQQPIAESPVDLGVALRLAGVENPTINLAREAIREAQAEQQAARALLLPTVNVGGNFYLHRGNLQAANGTILDVDRQSAYLGAGAQAVGTGALAFPGVRLFAHLGDAAYEPLAARQRVAARTGDARAVRNDILLDVAAAYLELIGAEERVRLLKQGEADLGEVVRLTAAYAKTGQGRSADANRAAAHFQLLARETQSAEEERAVAVARLARHLNLDPSVPLRTPAGVVPAVRLIPADVPVPSLLETALRSRPEMSARSAEVGLAEVRRRQEAVRPFLPVLSVGFSGGAFGGGSNRAASDFGPLDGRTDFDVAAVWNVEGFGFGNRARVRRAGAGIGQATAALERTKTEIGRQVAEAHAQVQAAARQFETATAAVSVAEEGFRLETERIKQGQGRPIEVLDSFRQLLDARLEVLRAIVAFDIAQFRLYAAIGGTPESGTPPG
jgi:outer membrane protein TolC